MLNLLLSTHFSPMFYSYTPWKLSVFWRFQEVYKYNIGLKGLNITQSLWNGLTH